MLALPQDGSGLLLVQTGWKLRDNGSSTNVAPTLSPRRGQPTPCFINTGCSLWKRQSLLILFFKKRKALNHQNDSGNLVAEGTWCPSSSRSGAMSGMALRDHLETHNCLGSLGPSCRKPFLNLLPESTKSLPTKWAENRCERFQRHSLDCNHKRRHN